MPKSMISQCTARPEAPEASEAASCATSRRTTEAQWRLSHGTVASWRKPLFLKPCFMKYRDLVGGIWLVVWNMVFMTFHNILGCHPSH